VGDIGPRGATRIGAPAGVDPSLPGGQRELDPGAAFGGTARIIALLPSPRVYVVARTAAITAAIYAIAARPGSSAWMTLTLRSPRAAERPKARLWCWSRLRRSAALSASIFLLFSGPHTPSHLEGDVLWILVRRTKLLIPPATLTAQTWGGGAFERGRIGRRMVASMIVVRVCWAKSRPFASRASRVRSIAFFG